MWGGDPPQPPACPCTPTRPLSRISAQTQPRRCLRGFRLPGDSLGGDGPRWGRGKQAASQHLPLSLPTPPRVCDRGAPRPSGEPAGSGAVPRRRGRARDCAVQRGALPARDGKQPNPLVENPARKGTSIICPPQLRDSSSCPSDSSGLVLHVRLQDSPTFSL